MATCPSCGMQIAEGAICDCRYRQQPQQQYGQQPYGQQPQQQYGQPQYGQYPQQQYGGFQKQIMPGKTMIRVIGILLIIIGASGLGWSINYIDDFSYGYEALGYVNILAALALLAVGIVATALASDKFKANLVLVFGIVTMALSVIVMVWFIAALGDAFSYYIEDRPQQFSIIGVGGLVLSILLVVGASKRKNAHI